MSSARATGGGGAAAAAAAAFTASEAGREPPSTSLQPIFYTHVLCPYAERVWLALLEKGVTFHLCHIDLSSKPAWYRRINSRGLVPAVQHAGQVHVESADVCRWIDGAFPGPALVPADPALQREMEALISGPCSGAVSAGLDLCAGKCRGRHWGIGSGQTAAQRAALEAQLGQLAAALQVHGGPYLLGADVSLADILVWPFLKRFSVAAPLTGYEVEANVHIQRWLAAMDARPSCATSAADPQLLLDAFRKHRSLDFFDFETFGAFELHPHNAHLLQQ